MEIDLLFWYRHRLARDRLRRVTPDGFENRFVLWGKFAAVVSFDGLGGGLDGDWGVRAVE